MKPLLNALFVFSAACILFGACKKPVSIEFIKPGPIKSGRGTNTGIAVTKTIDKSGGQLTSADGRLVLTVPADAVSSGTLFSIQPIRNTLDSMNTKPAYRLLPEGVSFSKPATLTFRYDTMDLKNTMEEYLTIAWQQPDGSWKTEPASLNQSARTISVETTHFSDWLVTGEICLVARQSNLAAGESTVVEIIGVNHDDNDVLAPLSPSGWSGTVSRVRDWKIGAGPGQLSEAPGGNAAGLVTQKTYTAPANNSNPQTAMVNVTLDGNVSIPDPTAPGGKRVFQNMILFTEINIVGKVYMIGTFGPVDINISEVIAVYANGRISIAGHASNISVGFTTNGATGSSFPSGDINLPGNSITNASYSLSPSQSFSFGSSYQECTPTPVLKYSGGSLILRRWGAVGEPVEGEFSGLLYSGIGNDPNGCPSYDSRMLTIRFSTVRSL